MKLLDRLNALDERFLPPPTVAAPPPSRWQALLSLIPSALLLWLAYRSGWWLPYAGFCVAAAIYLVSTGQDLARADLASRGVAVPSRSPSRAVAVVAGFAVVVGVAIGPFLDARYRYIDPREASALVAAVVEASASDRGRGVCRYARAAEQCRRAVDDFPRPHGEAPEVVSAMFQGAAHLATVTLHVPDTSRACTLVVQRHRGDLRVANPVYWTEGC